MPRHCAIEASPGCSVPRAVERLTFRGLFRSRDLAVEEVRCCGGGRLPGPEETTGRTEIVLIRSGVYVCHRDGETQVADANRALFLDADEPYRMSHPAGGDVSTLLVLAPALREAAVDAALRVGEEAAPRLRRNEAPVDSMADLVHRRLVTALAAGVADPFEVEETVLALAVHLLVAGSAGGAAGRRKPRLTRGRMPDLVARAQARLAAGFVSPLSLIDLAAELDCSPWHLSRSFRRITGTSLSRYRLRLRLRAAVDRLAAGEADLTSLALDLGFADHAHFTRTFRAELGKPPSALRGSPDAAELSALRKNLQAPGTRGA